jgi:hypothetical protein
MFTFLRNIKLAFDIGYVMMLTLVNICVPVVIGTIKHELKKIESDIDTNKNHYNVVSELTDLDSDSSVQSEESVTCGVVAENEPEDEICSK